jgi:hypothetical protein
MIPHRNLYHGTPTKGPSPFAMAKGLMWAESIATIKKLIVTKSARTISPKGSLLMPKTRMAVVVADLHYPFYDKPTWNAILVFLFSFGAYGTH